MKNLGAMETWIGHSVSEVDSSEDCMDGWASQP